MRLLYFLWITLLICGGCRKSNDQIYDLAIRNGQVINIETGEIEYQDIYIAHGRIVKIEQNDPENKSVAHTIINATGNFILPGFWDNHVHFRGGDSLIAANENFLKLFIANGITSVRDAGGDLTNSIIKWNKQIANGDLIGPRIYTSGPKIDGPNATWAGSLEVQNAIEVEEALDSLAKLKTDFVKIYDSRISRDVYLETVTQATKRGLISSGHMPFSVEIKENIEAGIDAIEHLYYVLKGCSSKEGEITQAIINKEYGFWQSMKRLIESYDQTTADEIFRQLKDNEVYVVPTLHIGHTLSYLDEVDHKNDPYLKLMSPGIVKTYQRRIQSALNSSEQARKERKELDAFFQTLAKSLFEANVKLLAGSDSGAYNSYTYPGVSLHKELEAMVGTGISPLGALQASAYNGANFLKQQADYGSIAPGKIADLVLLNRNPLLDIKNTRSIYRVIKSGIVFDPKIIAESLDCSECLIQ